MLQEIEESYTEDEEDEDEAPVKYDIATYPSDFTLSGIHKMWKDGDIEVPTFQRKFVWSIKQSSLLIESFLLGLPIPPVFFYIDEEHKNLVIDGQQRILTIVCFFDGFFGEESVQGKRQVFRLNGLAESSPYHNKSFSGADNDGLSQTDQRKLQNSVLRAINVRQLSPQDNRNTSIYHIFERLNTGGTALKPQEIRNCVFEGEFNNVLMDLNNDKNWRLLLGKENLDKHQRDIELILRIFSLSNNKWNQYERPMKEYLHQSMKKNRTAQSKRVVEFAKLFPGVCKLIVEYLGEKPFHIHGPLNSSVLDSTFVTLFDNFDRIPPDVKNRYANLLATRDYTNYISGPTTDDNVLKKRFDEARKYLIGQ